MSEDLAFFDLLMDSAPFVAAVDLAKEHWRATVNEVRAGAGQMSRDMAIAENAIKQATAAMAAQRLEAAKVGFAAGRVTPAGLQLATARSGLANVQASQSQASLEESSRSHGMLGGLGPQLALFGGLGLLGAAGGALALLDQLINKTAQHSTEVLRNAQVIGLNNQDMQLWDQLAEKVGLDQTTLIRSIGTFNKELGLGAPALKASTLTLNDLGITSRDTGTALLQAADYFHTHRDAVQNDQIALALFGRSGLAMLPILQQGSGAIRAYGEELKSFGIIMTDAQLATGAATEAIHNRFGEALKGIESQLTTALEPAFIALYSVITQVSINGGSIFQAMANGIAQAVGFLAGVLSGLTGTIVHFDEVGKDAGAAFDGLGAAAQNATGGIQGTGDATGNATKAIDDQIRALRDQKQAFDDSIDAQKTALQSQLDYQTGVDDGRRRQGEDLVTYERRLAEDKLKAQIGALDDQKSAGDRAYDDRINKLQDEKAAVGSATAAMAADYGAMSNSIQLDVGKAIDSIKGSFDKGKQSAEDFKTTVDKFLNDPAGTMADEAVALGTSIGKGVADGMEKQVWKELTSKSQGLMAILGLVFSTLPGGQQLYAAWKAMSDLVTAPGSPTWWGSTDNASQGSTGTTRPGSYALGGFVGRDGPAFLHSPEWVIPANNPARAAALLRQSGLDRLVGGGGMVQTVNFNGPVADEYVANRVASKLAREAARKTLAHRGNG